MAAARWRRNRYVLPIEFTPRQNLIALLNLL
jgi:hypothetical protein